MGWCALITNMFSPVVDLLACMANALLPSPVNPANCGMLPFNILGKVLSTPQNTATEKTVADKYSSMVMGNTCLFNTSLGCAFAYASNPIKYPFIKARNFGSIFPICACTVALVFNNPTTKSTGAPFLPK